MKKNNQSMLSKLAMGGILSASAVMMGCNDSSTSSDTKVTEDSKAALKAFTEKCIADGKTLEEHATCSGNNTCAGESFDIEKGMAVAHDCAGKNTCAGASCVDEAAASSETETSSATSSETDHAAALKVFRETCISDGLEVEDHATCKGTSTCAGASFSVENGKTIDHECAGLNECKGASCRAPAETSSSSAAEAMTLARFIEECEAAGKTVEENATCAGHSTCAGESFNSEDGSVVSHDCAGKNTCAGASCKS